MGTLVGHVAPGLGFLFLGFWHLLNHTKLHAMNPSSYTSLPWFPTSRVRYLELLFIMVGCSMSIAMELFIGPERGQPLDPDGSIPSNHLHNFEHSLISLSFLVYAVSAILLDRTSRSSRNRSSGSDTMLKLTQLVGAVAFAQQLLLFHLHSADHAGLEGQYHLLLQLVILVALSTTLLGIPLPGSFLVGFLRSTSVMFLGIWLVAMGFMLWSPGLVPKGCYIHVEDGHEVVRCSSEAALHRARSLVNIEFSWFLVVFTSFSITFYLLMMRVYGNIDHNKVDHDKISYWTIGNEMINDRNEDEEQENGLLNDDVEAQKLGDSGSFVHMNKAFGPIDMER